MTPIMLRVLGFVEAGIVANGYAPTYREISDGLSIGGPSVALGAVRRLERDGYIAFDSPLGSGKHNRHRGIRVAKLADGSPPLSLGGDPAILRAEAMVSMQRTLANFYDSKVDAAAKWILDDLAAAGIVLARYRGTEAKTA
jgi:SOS-response transcriptional repressor LexA